VKLSRRIAPTTLLAALLSLLVAGSVPAEQSESDNLLHEKWQQAYRQIAESLDLLHGETPLVLEPTPLLFYTNPQRVNGQHGTIFLWTERGRPAVFGSIWSAIHRTDPKLRNVSHELHSLADSGTVRAVRDSAELWNSGETGIAWQTLDELPAPAASKPARLVQMRRIARRLSARITAEEENELRLMPNPLYRYPEGAPGALDGALFVYAMATDPELVLLVEATTETASPSYRVAFARFGNLAMAARDGEQTIWTCDRGTPGRSDGKYYLRWRAEQMSAQPEKAPQR
jgi:hypothetical protein